MGCLLKTTEQTKFYEGIPIIFLIGCDMMTLSKLTAVKRNTLGSRLKKDWKKNYELYFLFLPIFIYYILFAYVPMYGISIAFQHYTPARGMFGSPFIGLTHFKDFLTNAYFGRIIKNTLVISLSTIVFGFPAPIILAILINEVRSKYFARTVQTISYIPHFISLVVVCGMVKTFTTQNGLIGQITSILGGEPKTLLAYPSYFVPIYVISDLWKEVGWGSIIYLAAISGVDLALYDAAEVDSANRFQKIWYITLPSIMPTIMILFIMRLGRIMSVGHEKILLLYNELTYETADVISTYVYRKGLLELSYSYSTAVGLFNNVVNLFLLILANTLSKKFTEQSLW